jgi:hypothetical protein
MAKFKIPETDAIITQTKAASAYLDESDTKALADEFDTTEKYILKIRRGGFSQKINLRIIELAAEKKQRIQKATAVNF